MNERRVGVQARLREELGVDEDLIDHVVRAFYRKAREDALLGPVFNAKIEVWEPHLKAIIDFWSSITLMTGRYHGQPMVKHLDLGIDARHFDRWLALWEETARELCPEQAAERLAMLSRRVGESLELGIATSRGVFLKKGERLAPAE